MDYLTTGGRRLDGTNADSDVNFVENSPAKRGTFGITSQKYTGSIYPSTKRPTEGLIKFHFFLVIFLGKMGFWFDISFRSPLKVLKPR